MATNPRDPSEATTDYADAASTIRFNEPRQLPLGLLAALAAGAVLVCLIVFFVMYKVNVAPTAPSGPGAAARTAPAAPAVAGEPVTAKNGKVIPGAVKETDGDITVSNAPSKCTFLEVHLKNLDQLERENPTAETRTWIEAKRTNARDQMARMGCK